MQIYKAYFAEKLRKKRKDLGFTQAELAEQIGVEPPTVSRWESGRDFPTEDKLPYLTKALSVSKDFFEIKNEESKLFGLAETANFLSNLSARSKDAQKLVLAIALADTSYLEGLPKEAFSHLRKLLETLGIEPLR